VRREYPAQQGHAAPTPDALRVVVLALGSTLALAVPFSAFVGALIAATRNARLVERGVSFVQLMHAGWDHHRNLTTQFAIQCKDTDQPAAALVKDLKQRGLLEDTLVIWGGEFGRTPFLQGNFADVKAWGRDHHPYAFTIWMAGGGIKPGMTYGASDEFGYNAVVDRVDVHDFQATVLHLLGIDHERLTHRFQGRQFRLTDVHGKVLQALLA